MKRRVEMRREEKTSRGCHLILKLSEGVSRVTEARGHRRVQGAKEVAN
jgi:hypothetical protein